MLRARDLTMTFHQGVENHVLKGVDLDIEEGQFVTIMGKSGSGKSTLLYLLSGLEKPTGGSVQFRGKTLHELKDKEMSNLRRKAFGFVFQFFNLVSSLNVRDNILLPITMERKISKEQEEKVAEYVNMLGIADKMNAYPHQLSGGQQQRVAIARALAIDPDIIFADEPTGNLDAQTSAEVLRAFFNLNKWLGKTIVMVTHDESIGRIFATREIHLVNGQVLDRGRGSSAMGNRAAENRRIVGSGFEASLEQNRLLESYSIGDDRQTDHKIGNTSDEGRRGGDISMENYPIKERSVDEHLRILKERRRAHRLMENRLDRERENLLESPSIEESRYEDTSNPIEQHRHINSLFRDDLSEKILPEKKLDERILPEKKLAEKNSTVKKLTAKNLTDSFSIADHGHEPAPAEAPPSEERLRLLEGRSGEDSFVEGRSIEERLRLLEARLLEARLMNVRKRSDRSKENRIVNFPP